MRGWPEIVAVRTVEDRPSGYYGPRLRLPDLDLESRMSRLEIPVTRRGQLVLPFMVSRGERKRHRAEIAWLRWCRLIPTDVREIVVRFRGNHWPILVLLTRCGRPAVDLASANPALAFALAYCFRFRSGTNLRALQDQLAPGRKQRDILGWLAFPATDASRRLLTKIDPEIVSVALLRRVRRLLRDPETARFVARLPRLNTGALVLLEDPALREIVAPSLVEEVCWSQAEDRHVVTAKFLHRILEMSRRLAHVVGEVRLPRSHDELRETYRQLVEAEQRFGGDASRVRFPDPPVMGTKTIVPITTAAELLQESWAQRHCVAAYVERVAREQDRYFYKVIEPERCTLMLVWDRGIWVAREIRKACNGDVSRETIRAVKDWLARMTGLPPEWSVGRELNEVRF